MAQTTNDYLKLAQTNFTNLLTGDWDSFKSESTKANNLKPYTDKTAYPSDFSKPSRTDFPNFWQLACVFDSMLDYLYVMKKNKTPVPKKQVKTLMQYAKDAYLYGITGYMSVWYDDWCWFGIAASKSFDPEYIPFFEDADMLEFFREVAINAWALVDKGDYASTANSLSDSQWDIVPWLTCSKTDKHWYSKTLFTDRAQVHTGSPGVWWNIMQGNNVHDPKITERQKADYKYFNSEAGWAAPRFPGGCWQYDMSSINFSCDDGGTWNKPPTPEENSLGADQVTLMSGLYLVFACRFMRAVQSQKANEITGPGLDRLKTFKYYENCATRTVGFLQDWINVKDADECLAQKLKNGMILRERVSSYAAQEKETTHKASKYYDTNRFWAGDQGLIIGGFLDYALITSEGSKDPKVLKLAQTLTKQANDIYKGTIHHFYIDGIDNMIVPFLPAALVKNAIGTEELDPLKTDPVFKDKWDYLSGTGIFWRYVLYACRRDSSFKTMASKTSILSTSGATDIQWGSYNPLFRSFNNLSTATCALYAISLK